MILQQFYLQCLSQASYLVADDSSRRAAVVDPRRDIDEYLSVAADLGLSIELVVLTHVHADFVPGHTELAAATGAEVAMGERAPVDFPVRRLADGERIELGDGGEGVVLEVLATPGHTPESVTIAVYASGRDTHPAAVLTGDTLFLGDVGRPDLLGSAGRTPEQMAAELYRSLHDRLLPLPDGVVVYPGHGAGSSCGKALSAETSSTMGEQRRTNYALAARTEADFVAAVTSGLGEPPAYFAEEVALNRSGHDAFDPAAPVGEIDPSRASSDALRGDVLLLDVREDQQFAAGHLPGAVNVGLSGRFAEHAAALHAPGQSIVLVGAGAEVVEARMRLARVGVDTVDGAASHPAAADLQTPSSRLTVTAAAERIASVPGLQVLDVRAPGEVEGGTLPGAANIPLPQLRRRLSELDPQRPVLVTCAGGYRSIAAASFLQAQGFVDVSDLLGGWGAWCATHQPVES